MQSLFARRGKTTREIGGVAGLIILLALPLFFAAQARRIVSHYVPAYQRKLNGDLNYAAHKGNVEQIQSLLDSGANIESRERGRGPAVNFTPLYWAVTQKKTENALFLLQKGADPNSKNDDFTPFTRAVEQGDLRVVRAMLAKGAHPNAVAPYLFTQVPTPVLLAAAQRNNIAVLKLLLDYGANPNVQDEQGHTPIAEVISQNQRRAALALLEKGAVPQGKASVTGSIWLWLMSAHRKNSLDKSSPDCPPNCLHVEVARALIQRGASLKEKDADGRSVLHLATMTGDPVMAKLLLEKGAQVDAVDKHGYTPLMLANSQVAPVILQHHPNLRLKNERGETALDIALSSDDLALRRVMSKAYGAKAN
ncbi:MAG TPA: ankyrin repeat domain-containing protein [Abditibacteriaceae bacterium]|jgi:ankyrin repeat protein